MSCVLYGLSIKWHGLRGSAGFLSVSVMSALSLSRILVVPSPAAQPHSMLAGGAAGKDKKKETKLGLTATKAGNFAEWYTEVVREAELISYYTVSGGQIHNQPLSPDQEAGMQMAGWACWHSERVMLSSSAPDASMPRLSCCVSY